MPAAGAPQALADAALAEAVPSILIRQSGGHPLVGCDSP